MKKLLLAAVTALLGFVSGGVSASAAPLEDGHYYKLKSLGTNFYLNINKASGNATFTATETVVYVKQNPANENQFQFRANDENGYLLGASGWNTVCNSSDTAHFWTVQTQQNNTTTNTVVTLYQDWATTTGGNWIGADSAPAENVTLYCNKGANKYPYWEIIEVPMPKKVNYTIKLGETTVRTFTELVPVGSKYTTATPPAGVTFSESINNEELAEDHNITVTVDDTNENLFKLLSARYTGTWGSTTLTGLGHTNAGKTFADGEWFIEVKESASSENFKIWSVNQARYVATIPNTGAVALSTTNPGTFKIIYHANGSEAITNSSNTVGVTGDFFNHQNNNVIGRWHADNDGGSYWFMIYDNAAWEANKLKFCVNGTGSLPGTTTNSSGAFDSGYTYPFQTAVADAQGTYEFIVGLGVENDAVTALNAKIAAAANLRFGRDNVVTYLTELEEAVTACGVDESRIALKAAIDALEAKPLGAGVGKYNTAAGDVLKILATAKAMLINLDATSEECANMAATLNGLTITLNLPQEGVLYRLRRPGTAEVYASSKNVVVGTRNRLPMVSHNGAETIWMLKDGKLVGLYDGKVMGDMISTDTSIWGSFFSTDTHAACLSNENGYVGFVEGIDAGKGKYGINVTANTTSARWIYSANDYVDAGSGRSTNTGYDWVIEEGIEWLPIALPADVQPGYQFTFCSPVALGNYQTEVNEVWTDRVKIYTITKQAETIVKSEIDFIPANTPVLIEYVCGYESDKGSVFLPVSTRTYEGNESGMESSVFAFKQTEETNYLAFNGTKFVRVENDGVINGFTPYFEDASAESYEVEEVAVPEDLTTHTTPLTFDNGKVYHNNKVSTIAHSVHKLDITLTPYDPEEESDEVASVAPMRRLSGNADEGYTLSRARVTFNDDNTTAIIDFTNVTPGDYKIDIPEKYFILGTDSDQEGGEGQRFYSAGINSGLKVNADGTITGINEVLAGMAQGAIYDLQGRRLAAPVKGINIIGGRKVLVK